MIQGLLIALPATRSRADAQRVATAARSSATRQDASRGQRPLALTIALEVTLVDIQTVRATRGVDAESVVELLEEGRIRWAWDVALPGASRRELRFLAAEVRGDAWTVTATRAQVIDAAVGIPTSRARVRAAELEQRWCMSAQTILRLGRAGHFDVSMGGHTKWVTRESLVRFLGQRWA